MVQIAEAKCPKCGHEWIPRVAFPKQCPNGECGLLNPIGKPPKAKQ